MLFLYVELHGIIKMILRFAEVQFRHEYYASEGTEGFGILILGMNFFFQVVWFPYDSEIFTRGCSVMLYVKL